MAFYVDAFSRLYMYFEYFWKFMNDATIDLLKDVFIKKEVSPEEIEAIGYILKGF